MKKIILFLLLSLILVSCVNLLRKRTNFEICMDCLHNKEFYYATNFCEKAIIEEPNNFNAYHFLGISYVKTEQFERALVCFDKAIQINPDFPNSWGWKGSVLKLLGKKEEGDECILKSKELEKKNDGRK